MSKKENRQILMGLLAKSPFEVIDNLWTTLNLTPNYELFRAPEIGLVQLQGKMGGTGNRFYVGDATITRAVVLIENKYYGYSYIMGRDKKKAQLCALIDGLMQINEYQITIEEKLLLPLLKLLETQKNEKNKATEATRVDFFTLVRGEDE
ncbi:phosphonate C-P lyase system protein PhnG [Thorsellia kenyensis]|uniref:Phosphonate C-P lyase system protein PhnG n=1 Tax=Thorsellia kenyensis TaxID=1549888 RepID=A0ABV6CBE3_9GAMM